MAPLAECGWDDGRFLAKETSDSEPAILANRALVYIDELAPQVNVGVFRGVPAGKLVGKQGGVACPGSVDNSQGLSSRASRYRSTIYWLRTYVCNCSRTEFG